MYPTMDSWRARFSMAPALVLEAFAHDLVRHGFDPPRGGVRPMVRRGFQSRCREGWMAFGNGWGRGGRDCPRHPAATVQAGMGNWVNGRNRAAGIFLRGGFIGLRGRRRGFVDRFALISRARFAEGFFSHAVFPQQGDQQLVQFLFAGERGWTALQQLTIHAFDQRLQDAEPPCGSGWLGHAAPPLLGLVPPIARETADSGK